MPPTRRWQPTDEPDDLVYAVCVRFLEQFHEVPLVHQQQPAKSASRRARGKAAQRGGATEIANWLRDAWNRPDLNRERVYPLVSEGVRRGFLLLSPPLEAKLAEDIAKKFQVNRPGQRQRSIHVVSARGSESSRHVTAAAAELVLKLIYQIGSLRQAERKRQAAAPGSPGEDASAVHLGLGGGLTTSLFAKRLARHIHLDRQCPPLVLHALSAGGFSVDQPERSPVTYISYFDGALPSIRAVGLFSPTVASNDEFHRLCENPSIRKAREQAEPIDIVVTSFASANHEHGLLRQYLQRLVDDCVLPPDTLDRMLAAGWRGDVQFRPYSAEAPMMDVCPVRAVTLFELDDLVARANNPDKYVLLLAGPCGECGQLKTDALHPLVANPRLRLWSHLVLDVDTALKLLDMEPEPQDLAPSTAEAQC